MAKKVVASMKKTDGKNLAKCIKMVKNPKTGGYQFVEEVIEEESTKDFFNKK